jgi:ADP-ribose pyrophosphatase YjhB (NUDIX family)
LELAPDIRNAARALIIRRGRILLLRKEGGGRAERFALPGGAQDPGETLQAALNRECIEEIGTPVEIDDLIHVADFFKLRDTEPPSRRHVVEFLFRCSVPDDYSPRNGHQPDRHQVEVVWVSVDAVPRLPLFPQFLTTCIPRHQETGDPFYLGTFHDQAAP